MQNPNKGIVQKMDKALSEALEEINIRIEIACARILRIRPNVMRMNPHVYAKKFLFATVAGKPQEHHVLYKNVCVFSYRFIGNRIEWFDYTSDEHMKNTRTEILKNTLNEEE